MQSLFSDTASVIDLGPDLSPEDSQRLQNRVEELVLLGAQKRVQPGDAIGLPQSYFDAFNELAVRHYRQKNYDSAVKLYTRLVQLKPYELGYYKGLGACYLGLERYDSAIKAYACGQYFGALDAELHYYLGLAYYFNKEIEPAFEWIRFARVLDEQDAGSDKTIAAFATQLLTRMQALVSPEQAAKMDVRP